MSFNQINKMKKNVTQVTEKNRKGIHDKLNDRFQDLNEGQQTKYRGRNQKLIGIEFYEMQRKK